MISDRGIEALRMAATLAHALPINLRLRHDARVFLEVARPPFEPTPGAEWVPPCEFRAATVGAWGLHRDGRPVAVRGLPDGVDPAVDIRLPPGGCARPGGIYQLPRNRLMLYVFATTAPPEHCRTTAEPSEVGVCVDEATGVALVHLATDDPADEPDVIETLEELLATLTAAALLTDLAGLPRR